MYSLREEIVACPNITKKVRESEEYAVSLYRALCNNTLRKMASQDDPWRCSWRYAGSLIAEIRREGDYLDWYCSGGEGFISDEVKRDLANLGWIVI